MPRSYPFPANTAFEHRAGVSPNHVQFPTRLKVVHRIERPDAKEAFYASFAYQTLQNHTSSVQSGGLPAIPLSVPVHGPGRTRRKQRRIAPGSHSEQELENLALRRSRFFGIRRASVFASFVRCGNASFHLWLLCGTGCFLLIKFTLLCALWHSVLSLLYFSNTSNLPYLSYASIYSLSAGAHVRPTYSLAPGTIDEVKIEYDD